MRASYLLILLCALVSACSPYRDPTRDSNQYECTADSASDPELMKALEPLAFRDIHLTAQGALVDRCQWDALMRQINNDGIKDDRSKIILMHIHGWKHNADPEDSERKRFKDVVDRIALEQQTRSQNNQVMGIFVAWPGLSMDFAGLQNLTFFSRTTVADRVSQSAIVGKLIGNIESILNKRKAKGSNDVFIMMGYSLGARILFNATSQVALYQTQLAAPDLDEGTYDIVDGPGDLVMLLNPALSAGNYTAIDSLRNARTQFSPKQNPIMLTISANNDSVTKHAYPIGHILRFKVDREHRTAIGEYPEYITHRLERREHGNIKGDESTAWYDNFCVADICLERLPSPQATSGTKRNIRPRQPSNPFIVAKTTPEIIDGHSGFWNSGLFASWLGGFVENTLNEAQSSR